MSHQVVNVSGTDNATTATESDEELLDAILEFINPKIYQWIFIALFIIVFFVGISGNFLVCFSVWKSRSLKSVTNFFLVNLAVADFFVILFCLPASVIFDTIQSWFLGLAMCKLFVYVQRVCVFVSILTLMSISVERYMVICHPLNHQRNYFKTRLIICGIWILSLIIPAGDFYNMILKHNLEVSPSLRPWLTACAPKSETMERNFNIFLAAAFYILPLSVMTYTYFMIATCLWSSSSTRNAVSENLHYESAVEQLKARRRTAKMLMVVVITFALCYLPIHVINIVRFYDVLSGLSRHGRVCVYWTARFLFYLNSAINPVIYNFMSKKFQSQFKTACFSCYSYVRICCRCFTTGEDVRREFHQITMESFPSRANNQRSTFITGFRPS